mmetsp:Transcript_72803/g.109833  ORF Transcript_72803/g.109833 Transcript_72803/m.109833 type:complete len:228 (-) Transcript_72803:62-745(-)
MQDWQALAIALFVPTVIASASGVLVQKNLLWFMSLLQSKFTPEPRSFRIIWPVVHVLMGISSFLIYKQEGTVFSTPLIIYGTHLFFLSLHCPLFFSLKRQDLALLDNIITNMILSICTFSFLQTNLIAGLILVPYFLWMLFFLGLTADFYRLELGVARDPVFFTENYSPHHLYESRLAEKESKQHFFSVVPDEPAVTKPKIVDPSESKLHQRNIPATKPSMYLPQEL